MEVITLSQEPNLNWIKLLELPFPSLRTHAKEVLGQVPTKMTNREADHFGKMHVETHKDYTVSGTDASVLLPENHWEIYL